MAWAISRLSETKKQEVPFTVVVISWSLLGRLCCRRRSAGFRCICLSWSSSLSVFSLGERGGRGEAVVVVAVVIDIVMLALAVAAAGVACGGYCGCSRGGHCCRDCRRAVLVVADILLLSLVDPSVFYYFTVSFSKLHKLASTQQHTPLRKARPRSRREVQKAPGRGRARPA